MSIVLSINVNKIATIRNARGGDIPSVVDACIHIQLMGADGITVHPRPDERHIRYSDVRDIKTIITGEFNIEGNPQLPAFIDLVLENRPSQVTLVPDASNQLTSNHGWDTIKYNSFLKHTIALFKEEHVRTSIFINPDIEMIKAAADTGTDRVELYTENYARKFKDNKKEAIQTYVDAALEATSLKLELNAGHDLTLQNVNYFCTHIPKLKEVSIGHAVIADALYLGLEQTIKRYRRETTI